MAEISESGGNEKKWFLAFADHHEGPFTPDEIRSKINSSGVGSNPFVWCEGMKDWLHFQETPLARQVPPPMAPPRVPPPMPAPAMPAPAVKSPGAPSLAPKSAAPVVRDENELSGFYELSPQNAEDRTEFIDKRSLKEARKEAKKAMRIEKSAADGMESGGGTGRMRTLVLVTGVIILLGLVMKYLNII